MAAFFLCYVQQDKGKLELLNVEELAAQFRLPPTMIYTLVKTKGLPCLKLGPNDWRFDSVAVRRWIDAGVGEAAPKVQHRKRANDNPLCRGCQRPLEKNNRRKDGTYRYRCRRCKVDTSPIQSDPTTPWCIKCHRPFQKNQKRPDGIYSYRCGGCGISFSPGFIPIQHDLALPWCLQCHRPFKKDHKRVDGTYTYRCKGCGISFSPGSVPIQPDPTFPWCIKCRRPFTMCSRRVDGTCLYRCRLCGATEGKQRHPSGEDLTRPWCIKCRHPMKKHGYTPDWQQKFMCHRCNTEISPRIFGRGENVRSPGRQEKFLELVAQGYSVNKAAGEVGIMWLTGMRYFKKRLAAGPLFCRCGELRTSTQCSCLPTRRKSKAKAAASVRGRRKQKHEISPAAASVLEWRQQALAEGDNLPVKIAAEIPKSVRADVREEVCQNLVVATLDGKVNLRNLASVMLVYVSKAYAALNDRYKHVFIDHPNANGTRLKDILVG
jgi:transposase-like protein